MKLPDKLFKFLKYFSTERTKDNRQDKAFPWLAIFG